MHSRSISSALALAIGIAACAPSQDAGVAADTTAADTGAALSVSAPVRPLGESGAAGRVTFVPRGSAVEVAVHLMGVGEGNFTARVYRGTCTALGAEAESVAELGTLTIGTSGMVDYDGTLNVPLERIADGQHVLAFHRGSGGPHIACADIPRRD